MIVFMEDLRGVPDSERKKGESLEIKIKGDSLASLAHPDKNEDAFFVNEKKRMMGVFDGMGGHGGGDLAALAARDDFFRRFSSMSEELSVNEIARKVKVGLLFAHEAVIERGRQVGNREMGTTASVVYFYDAPNGEKKAVIGNVGDSRVYRFRNGNFEQITLDDAGFFVGMSESKARSLQEKFGEVTDASQLTLGEQEIYKRRNVIGQSLGRDGVDPKIYIVDLWEGDKILVCSDGVSDVLTKSEMVKILKGNETNVAATRLVVEARSKGIEAGNFRKKRDDMTALVTEVGSRRLVSMGEGKPKLEDRGVVGGEIENGSVVRVKRSDGGIDDNWVVLGIDSDKGMAKVGKNGDDGRYMTKEVRMESLKGWNEKIL